MHSRGIYQVASLQDGMDIQRAMEEKMPRRIVIVGGGYIGLEMAENLVHRGCDVAVVEKAPQVMNTVDPDMADAVAAELRRAGITLFLEEALTGFDAPGGEVRAVMTDRQTLPADLVIMALGVRPNAELARQAGIAIGTLGGIAVDERMQTGTAGIWAAGNCVETKHLVSGRPVLIAQGPVANKQGRVAGINIAGGRASFPGAVGTAMAKIFDLEVARTGLQEKDLVSLDIPFISARAEGRTRSRYYPGSGKISVKVLAQKGTGRFLGAQIVGEQGSAKRIDVLAAALQTGLNVEEMISLDLGHCPPFSTAWDPVLLACRSAADRV